MATKKMAIIATKGALDMAYPPLILASTAAALGWDVQVFFTFYGLQLLRKDLSGIAISPLGNPAMPMPVPMPVIVSVLPGMQAMATSMMKAKMKKKGVASLTELRDLCLEAEVKSLQKAHFGLRMQKATQQLNNTGTLRVTRRDIARAKTILAQKKAESKAAAK